MRVVAYNLQGCVRGVDWVGGVLRDLAPDIACLTEVHRSHLSRLERLTGRRAAFGPARRIGMLGRFGNAVLARTRPRIERVVRLSQSPGMESRCMLVTRVGDLLVASVHLGLTAEERARHAREILESLPADGPAILAGDLNERPDGPAVVELLGRLDDAYALAGGSDGDTFPSTNPDRRIDYVLVRGLRVKSAEVPAVAASDHRPVVVDLDAAGPR